MKLFVVVILFYFYNAIAESIIFIFKSIFLGNRHFVNKNISGNRVTSLLYSSFWNNVCCYFVNKSLTGLLDVMSSLDLETAADKISISVDENLLQSYCGYFCGCNTMRLI